MLDFCINKSNAAVLAKAGILSDKSILISDIILRRTLLHTQSSYVVLGCNFSFVSFLEGLFNGGLKAVSQLRQRCTPFRTCYFSYVLLSMEFEFLF